MIKVGHKPLSVAALAVSCVILMTSALATAFAHGLTSRGIQPLDWHTGEINRVVTSGTAVNSFGLMTFGMPGEMRMIDNKRCFVGGHISIDVEDMFAYDIDETVQITMEFDRQGTEGFVIAYDKNGSVSSMIAVDFDKNEDERWISRTVSLERARFIGRGDFASDILIVAPGAMALGSTVNVFDAPRRSPSLTICDIKIERSHATPAPVLAGRLNLNIRDETGQFTAARVGLYDATGRQPHLSGDALPVKHYSDVKHTVAMRPGRLAWPHENRYAFYVDGQYGVGLPAGTYTLVVSKGIEYRIIKTSVTIQDRKTTTLEIPLERALDMPAEGWYSGDGHIHHPRRNIEEDRSILLQAQAEDLNVANILQMGNLGRVYNKPKRWGVEGRHEEGDVSVVSGQEDPRTSRRGHTVHYNMTEGVHKPDSFVLYHEVFEAVARQGGLSGYAHLWAGSADGITETPGVRAGLAVDVPFDLVDVVEVLQIGDGGNKTWFDFLNLGYKLMPVTGTDYPFVEQPGAIRSYVQIDGGYSTDAWFDGLEAGRSFATNGPMLDMNVNGTGLGGELNVGAGDRLRVKASARINPDIDLLTRLDLIVQGEVIKSVSSADGAESLNMDFAFEAPAEHGTWVVLRAVGRRQSGSSIVAAVSSPIFVLVDGKSFWKPEAVPAIVAGLKKEMQIMLDTPQEVIMEAEPWDSPGQWPAAWARQEPMLADRVREAVERYDAIAEAAAKVSKR